MQAVAFRFQLRRQNILFFTTKNQCSPEHVLVVSQFMANVMRYRRHALSSQPSSLYEPYRATARRAPSKPLIFLPHTLSEITGPVYGHSNISETDSDLTRQHSGEPMGERI